MKQKTPCPVCNKSVLKNDLVDGHAVLPSTASVIQKEFQDWSPEKKICTSCLNKYREVRIEEILKDERGKISDLEKEFIESFRTQDLLTENPNQEFDEQLSFGERVADKVAEFGGSWKFIILFMVFLLIWMGLNTWQYLVTVAKVRL